MPLAFLTRELAHAMAHDDAMRATARAAGWKGAGYPLLKWTDVTVTAYATRLRDLWTLDDEFAQQEFEATHGRKPNAVSDDDYRAMKAIARRQQADRPPYGRIPD